MLLGVAAVGLWAERTRLGGRLSAMVVALLSTMLLSNLGVIPAAAPAYDAVWGMLVPLAIPLLLFRADLRRILREAGPTLLAFVAGGVGSILGTLVAFALVPLGPSAWKLAGIFAATYIGGSMNYVAVSRALDLRDGDLLAAGVAADNLVMALFFLVLFALPGIGRLRRAYARRHDEADTEGETSAPQASDSPTLLALATALAVSAAVCAVGFGLESALGIRGLGILVITALVVAAATLAPRAMSAMRGTELVGTYLMQVFFATIGASAHVGIVLRVGPSLFAFTGIILVVHLAFTLAVGKLLRLDLAEIVIASNANVGGPTTAAAMATARRWHALVIPAILCGTLGYSTATFIGIGLGHLLR